MKIVAFFNNTSGVGKTSLLYHVAWMLSDFNYRVIAADFDPQADLTSMFLNKDALEALWSGKDGGNTVYRMVEPLARTGDIREPAYYAITENLTLLPGDIQLSGLEDQLSAAWTHCLAGDMREFSMLSALYRSLIHAADVHAADVVLVDIGPNLSAINRAALLASDRVIVPVAADLLALRGMISLGPQLRIWREGWQKCMAQLPRMHGHPPFPIGVMPPIGYIVTQHAIRRGKPSAAHDRAVMTSRIPAAYRACILGEPGGVVTTVAGDEHCLAILKSYRSLMEMAQDAQKPIFHLTAADGALGAHRSAVHDCYRDFDALTRELIRRCGIRKADEDGQE